MTQASLPELLEGTLAYISPEQTGRTARGLHIEMVLPDETATIVWHGHCENRTPETILTPYFRELLPTLKGKKVTVDFRPFVYMNSATQAPILQWLKSLDRSRIPVRVIYNANLE